MFPCFLQFIVVGGCLSSLFWFQKASPATIVDCHITWKSQGLQEGWIVQWKARTIGGYHQRQQDAAKTLQDAMGLVSISELPRVHPASSITKISRYIGVYWHKQKKRYTTRDFCGFFHTATAAARAIGAERKRVKPSVLMQRVMCIRQAMGQKKTSLSENKH